MAGEMNLQSPNLNRRDPRNELRRAMERTDQVERELDHALGDYQDAVFNLLSMIPDGAWKLAQRGAPLSTIDKGALLHASRIFNNALGALILVRRGLIVEATTLARSAHEATEQAMLLFRRPELMKKWVSGRQFKPSQVREQLDENPVVRDMYSRLSEIVHANASTGNVHTLELPDSLLGVYFGGFFRLKDATRVLAQLSQTLIDFVEVFQDSYEDVVDLQAWDALIGIAKYQTLRLLESLRVLKEDIDTVGEYVGELERYHPTEAVAPEADPITIQRMHDEMQRMLGQALE